MPKSKSLSNSGQAVNSFQFTLAGLIIFSVTIISLSSLITWKLTSLAHPATLSLAARDKYTTIRNGSWGTLLTRDIELQRPAEYMTDEVSNPKAEVWTFNGQSLAAVKNIFIQNGLTADQINEALAAGYTTEKATGLEFRPSEKFLLSLSPQQRQKLYLALAGSNVNLYIDFPYIFPGNQFDKLCASGQFLPDELALIKQLAYANDGSTQLSDYDFLLQKIPTVERRTKVSQLLSQQTAVLTRLSIQGDTDIDKIAAYWSNVPNVRFMDIRPMMDSLKQLPEGGSISLVYLLPKFARERLYTYPLPSQAGDPTMDCHWSTFNFSNETPDNRFNDPAYAVDYIRKNFYQIAAPSQYGDILLLINDKQEVKHSAVFIADDIVFTKNGNNYRQPWMLMHISDLLATYPAHPPMKAVYMRRKSE